MSIGFESRKSVITPEGVFIIGTYDENGTPNAMNAAWGIPERKGNGCGAQGLRHLPQAELGALYRLPILRGGELVSQGYPYSGYVLLPERP